MPNRNFCIRIASSLTSALGFAVATLGFLSIPHYAYADKGTTNISVCPPCAGSSTCPGSTPVNGICTNASKRCLGSNCTSCSCGTNPTIAGVCACVQ